MNSLPDEIMNKIYQHYFTENCIQEFYEEYETNQNILINPQYGGQLFYHLKPKIRIDKSGPNKKRLMDINKDYKTFTNWDEDYKYNFDIYW